MTLPDKFVQYSLFPIFDRTGIKEIPLGKVCLKKSVLFIDEQKKPMLLDL